MIVGCAAPNIVKIGPKTNVAADVTVLHCAAIVTEDTHFVWHTDFGRKSKWSTQDRTLQCLHSVERSTVRWQHCDIRG